MSTSVISHPTRGKWGKSSWRGNCSGHVYKDIFEQLRPETFCDPMVGSGTSVEVASEMGIEAFGLDLHSGFNILRHSILDATGKPAAVVWPFYLNELKSWIGSKRTRKITESTQRLTTVGI